MTTQLASSNEFAALVNQLQSSPNDSSLKQRVVQNLPKMMALAKDNPMALYHLAHIYPPNSPQYKQMMRQSANMGCTNAMFVLCQILGKSNNRHDLEEAVNYMRIIEKSNDSYIKSLLAECPPFAATIQEQKKPRSDYNTMHRFFPAPQETEATTEPMEEKSCHI